MTFCRLCNQELNAHWENWHNRKDGVKCPYCSPFKTCINCGLKQEKENKK